MTHGAALPYKALTNHTYARSLSYLRGRRRAVPSTDKSSLGRFYRSAMASRRPYRSRRGVARGFEVLDGVRAGTYTKWQIVYEPRTLKIHFRLAGARGTKTVDVKRLAKSCATPVRYLDLRSPASGDVSRHFKPLTLAVNRRRVEESLGRLHIAMKLLAPKVARYPLNARCR
mgnify:CR=1 FL=1